MLVPDSHTVSRIVASPNHGERRDVERPDMLVLHYTGMQDAHVALSRLCEASSEVSAHYFVFADGEIVQCVAEAHRAWHAGEACWARETDINSRSIGIEIANPGHDWGYADFPAVQIAAVTALCRDIIGRHPIPPQRVLAHSDVAPARKQDPGERFPWDRLAAAGIGLWVRPEPPVDGGLRLGDSGAPVRALQGKLAHYGYCVTASGTYDAAMRDVVAAFQRHFRPARVDGIADRSTVTTLEKLLAARAAAT
jgi:N-acetylmuramoyl-L-alanine amidase